MSHFLHGSSHLLCDASKRMPPNIGFAESHGMKRQTELSPNNPRPHNLTGIGIMKHFMGRLQLMGVGFVAVVVMVVIVRHRELL
jgi:hypothetical protein